MIARSEEHSPFPLETRTARGTPAPPSSGQYVPLKQYINQNFQSKIQPHQKIYPNYNYAQPQKAIQYKSQPHSSGQYQKYQHQSSGQYTKQQHQSGQYHEKSPGQYRHQHQLTDQYNKQQTQSAQIQYQRQQPAVVYQKQTPKPAVQYQRQPPKPAVQYQKPQLQSTGKPQNQPAANKISTVQEKIPLFPPLVQLKAQQSKKQGFETYQQFAFKTIPIAQRRLGLAEFSEAEKPNYTLFSGVSSYDVPLSSIGVLRSNNRVQG